MIKLNVAKDFDLRKITLDLSDELNKGIDVIALDIQQGIERKEQFGKPIPENEESTLKIKRRRGWGEHPLIAGKKLLYDHKKMSKTKARKTEQRAILAPHDDRVDIAKWLQIDGVETKHGIKHYEFWGISEKAEKEIMTSVSAAISKEVDRA